MKKEITRFGKALLIVVGLLIFVDISIGALGDRLALNMPSFGRLVTKDNYRLHRMNSEVVIIGSSRGAHHYVTSQLNDSIDTYFGRHVDVYNASIPGHFANNNFCAVEVIIERYQPKLLIVEQTENQMCAKDVASDLEHLTPYYSSDSIVKRYIDNLGKNEKVLMRSNMYRYNNQLLNIASAYLMKGGKDDGYIPLKGTSINLSEFQYVDYPPEALNPYSEANFRSMIQKCQSKGIPIVVSASPFFRAGRNNNQVSHICEEYGVRYIDLFNEPYFNQHPELFKDPAHLNDTGARLFTDLFYQQFKPLLKEVVFE